MPEGVGYGPQNTASVGLNLNVIGNHAYAYSGSVSVGTTETTLLEFTTGNYYLVATVHFSKNNPDGDDMMYQVYLDNIAMIGIVDEYSQIRDVFFTPIPLIIPPYTGVKVTADDLTTDNGRPIFASIVGKIHE